MVVTCGIKRKGSGELTISRKAPGTGGKKPAPYSLLRRVVPETRSVYAIDRGSGAGGRPVGEAPGMLGKLRQAMEGSPEHSKTGKVLGNKIFNIILQIAPSG